MLPSLRLLYFRSTILLVPKETRTGEDCEGKRRRFGPGMVRYVGANADAWACTRHWTRINRASHSFCACPLHEHSGELLKQNIPVRFHALFDRVGRSIPGYRPGMRWCCKCCKSADKLFKPELRIQSSCKGHLMF